MSLSKPTEGACTHNSAKRKRDEKEQSSEEKMRNVFTKKTVPFADLTFDVRGTKFEACKSIIATESRYWRNRLLADPTATCIEVDKDPTVFGLWLYTFHHRITNRTLCSPCPAEILAIVAPLYYEYEMPHRERKVVAVIDALTDLPIHVILLILRPEYKFLEDRIHDMIRYNTISDEVAAIIPSRIWRDAFKLAKRELNIAYNCNGHPWHGGTECSTTVPPVTRNRMRPRVGRSLHPRMVPQAPST